MKGWLSCLIWILPLGLAALTLFQAIAVTNDVPLADEWRWMRDLLIPYQRGEIGFWQFITGEYAFLSHSHYFTLLSILGIHNWLNMDFAYLAYIGLVAYVLTWVMLVRYYLALHNHQLDLQRYLALLLVTIAYFSPLSDFPWLLVMFEYVYFLIALGLLCLYDLQLRGGIRFRYFLAAFAFSVLFADAIGLIAVLTVLAWALVLNVFRQQPWIKSILLWGTFGALLLIQYLLLGKGVSGVQPLSAALSALLRDPWAIPYSLLSTFSLPLADKTVFGESALFGDQVLAWRTLTGLLGVAITLAALWLYWRAEAWRISYIPVLLVLFGLVAWACIFVSRYLDGGAEFFDGTRRFVRQFTTYYLGVGFALSLVVGARVLKVTLAILLLMMTIFLYVSHAQHQRVVHVKHYFDSARNVLLNEPVDAQELQRYIVGCEPGRCETAIGYLRENHLSVFSEPSR